MWGKLTGVERAILVAVVTLGSWHYMTSRHAPIRFSEDATATPPQISEVNPVHSAPFSALTSRDPAPGTPTISREGDPCKVSSVTNNQHPKGYPSGYTLKESKLYCKGKSGYYALDNIGIYKQGKLYSSVRKKIEDGHCHLLSVNKTAIPKTNNAVLVASTFSCTKNGQKVLEQILRFNKGGKRVLTQVSIRELASVKGEK